ncbi:SGNH/GDSL hydrolase family protein [Fusibacter sp. 3D3]|uniref:SGNH/GDSL hydrolase family protein n=1 Tax=Fusibacter sp. 3D3 TaxID=1048380 RepID=UPI0008536E13|nr:SGNH/GDSL hydrolase family protein [Fusibacter sp. 3D3]GAU78986.1 lipase/acylhydrolase [Fusibacter sp. 3D3]
MKILVAGDSISEGITGVSYLKKLEQLMPDCEFVNLGLGGDTIIGIGNRILEHLKTTSDYDIIILEAGHNDILLPIFEQNEFMFKMTAFTLRTRGSIPIKDPEIFKGTYLSTLRAIRKLSSAKLFVSTLSCINEDLTAISNIKRTLYNQKIRKLVEEFNANTSEAYEEIIIIEIADVFNHYLSEQPQTSYLLNNYFSAFIKDAHNNITETAADALSGERNLNLTIDGVHLNSKGAHIYSHLFYQTIKSALM